MGSGNSKSVNNKSVFKTPSDLTMLNECLATKFCDDCNVKVDGEKKHCCKCKRSTNMKYHCCDCDFENDWSVYHCCECKKIIYTSTDNVKGHCLKCHETYNVKEKYDGDWINYEHCCECKNITCTDNFYHCSGCHTDIYKHDDEYYHCTKCHGKYSKKIKNHCCDCKSEYNKKHICNGKIVAKEIKEEIPVVTVGIIA